MSEDTTEEILEPIPADSEAVTEEVETASEGGEAAVTGGEAEADAADDAEDEIDEADDGESAISREAALENEGEIAADYLEELLDIADLDGDIDTYVEGGRAHVSILTDSDVLVGKDGEVLEALQELCRLAVMTDTGKRSRLMLDIASFREKRRAELRALAVDAIAEVKENGEPVSLAAMNPFERKIVHDEVAAAGLFSESEGEEPQRRVVIHPKQPEPVAVEPEAEAAE
ncbi:MAG: protein jag [Propionibacteriaceae bacterium]|jgi:spoIIIJ-associated protein|nr:protein jag [Propionibacteriaceae bacterium]